MDKDSEGRRTDEDGDESELNRPERTDGRDALKSFTTIVKQRSN